MGGHYLNLRVASMIGGVQQAHHFLRRERCVLNNRLVDRQELVPDRQGTATVRNTSGQNVAYVDSCWHNLVQLLQRIRLQSVCVQVVCQDEAQFLTQRTLDLDEQRTQRVLHTLHYGHVVLDGQVAQARQVALTF